MHLNLEECVAGNMYGIGIPFLCSRINKSMLIKVSEEKYKDLFFEFQNMIWFRSNFKARLEKNIKNDSNKKILKKLYHHQCHLKVILREVTENDSLTFMNELARYLCRFYVHNLKRIKIEKNNTEAVNIIKKIRKSQEIKKIVQELWKIDNHKEYEEISQYYVKLIGHRTKNSLVQLLEEEWDECFND